MEKAFSRLSNELFNKLKKEEYLILFFEGENSQFIRFNRGSIRQTGLVDDSSLMMKYICDGKSCQGSYTISGNFDLDLKRGSEELIRLREEAKSLPADPFVVIPGNLGSTREIKKTSGLENKHTVDALLPAISDLDFVGIWASGKVFRGNSNNLGQRHWFETDSFCLDYSLVTPEHQMVKGTFTGNDWDQNQYEAYIEGSRKKLEMMKRKPIKVDTGKYRTWFESAAVADLLGMFSWNGISEASLQQGCSGFGRMRHQNIELSDKFSIAEDFTSGLSPKFNTNGEISNETLDLIDKGRLKNTLISTRSAKEYNLKSNFAETGEFMRSPIMATGDLEREQILKNLDTGLYLSNIHYLNWSDNPGGRITGLTRYACFWVEGGEIKAPIETMRFDDSFYNFFGENLIDVENTASINPEVSTYGGRSLSATTCPGILVDNFTLTL